MPDHKKHGFVTEALGYLPGVGTGMKMLASMYEEGMKKQADKAAAEKRANQNKADKELSAERAARDIHRRKLKNEEAKNRR